MRMTGRMMTAADGDFASGSRLPRVPCSDVGNLMTVPMRIPRPSRRQRAPRRTLGSRLPDLEACKVNAPLTSAP